MSTFLGRTSLRTLGAVAVAVDQVEDQGHEVHTIILELNGQHGEFDLTVLATSDGEFIEDHKFTGIVSRLGGEVADFKEVADG